MKITTKTALETKGLGEKFATKLSGGEVLALSGDLGSGKTTFVQGLASGLGIKQRVISPTFILMRKYNTQLKIKSSKFKITNQSSKVYFYHVDLYRLGGNIEGEVKNLGLDEMWGKPENIVAIEWADKIKKILPKNAIWINFKSLNSGREIIISGL